MSQTRFGTHKDVKKCIRKAMKQGWDVTCNGDQHIKIVPTSGRSFIIPMTPGSQGRVRNVVRQFRNAGLQG